MVSILFKTAIICGIFGIVMYTTNSKQQAKLAGICSLAALIISIILFILERGV